MYTQADLSKTVDFCKIFIFSEKNNFFHENILKDRCEKKMEKKWKMKNRIGLDTIWWKTPLKHSKLYNNKVKYTLTDPLSELFIFLKKNH